MSERLTRTVRWMMMAAGLAAAGGAGAGDDLKNIGIGAGIGILGQIVQGKPITLESALESVGPGSEVRSATGAERGGECVGGWWATARSTRKACSAASGVSRPHRRSRQRGEPRTGGRRWKQRREPYERPGAHRDRPGAEQHRAAGV